MATSEDSGEMVMSDTWLLLCVLGESAGCRLAVRQVNASGFHANVWNEHGTDKGRGWEENVGWNEAKSLSGRSAAEQLSVKGWQESYALCSAGCKQDGVNRGFARALPPCRLLMQRYGKREENVLRWMGVIYKAITTRSSKVHFTVQKRIRQ